MPHNRGEFRAEPRAQEHAPPPTATMQPTGNLGGGRGWWHYPPREGTQLWFLFRIYLSYPKPIPAPHLSLPRPLPQPSLQPVANTIIRSEGRPPTPPPPSLPHPSKPGQTASPVPSPDARARLGRTGTFPTPASDLAQPPARASRGLMKRSTHVSPLGPLLLQEESFFLLVSPANASPSAPPRSRNLVPAPVIPAAGGAGQKHRAITRALPAGLRLEVEPAVEESDALCGRPS
ncbi:protein ALEX-like [Petaurus breviceps papuanus]|uniref:protein ALEX-like n=1 Tax=Petaurus breviceps papuanus TaxID=3040969 RepID=UPI0036DB39FE